MDRAEARTPPSWLAQARILFAKDMAVELRSGEVTTTSAFFALLVTILASLSFYEGAASPNLAAGVIWVAVAFAAVLALGRSFQREREERALDGLLAAPVARSAIFVGKMASTLVFLWGVELVVFPTAALLFSLEPKRVLWGFTLAALLATPGIAAAGTLFGAMTVRTGARELILAIVLFPLLSPTLLAAVAYSRELIFGASLGELLDYLKLIAIFDLTFVVGGLLLFGLLIER